MSIAITAFLLITAVVTLLGGCCLHERYLMLCGAILLPLSLSFGWLTRAFCGC